MALGTTPSVEGAASRVRALLFAGLYAVGCVAGGAALGGLASGLAGVAAPRGVWLALAAALALLYLALDRRVLPERSWQVPKSWWERLGLWAFLPAGFTLTLGFLTPIVFPTYFVFVALLAAVELPAAVAVGAAYGALRSVSNWRGALGAPTAGLAAPGRIFGRQRRRFEVAARASLVLVVLMIVGIGLEAAA